LNSPQTEDARRSIRPAYHGVTAKLQHFHLKNIECPVLVIAGKDDVFTPRWMSEETAANIPGSDLHLYDNAGHAFHWECMNDFNPRTTEWLLKH
jgi:pimeloyl-ACP methyl ester carboxylesterase